MTDQEINMILVALERYLDMYEDGMTKASVVFVEDLYEKLQTASKVVVKP